MPVLSFFSNQAPQIAAHSGHAATALLQQLLLLLLPAAVVAEMPPRHVQRGAAREAHGAVVPGRGQDLDVVAQGPRLVDDVALDPLPPVLAVEDHHLLHPAGPPARGQPAAVAEVLEWGRG